MCKHILVIEDKSALDRHVWSHLEKEGYNVTVAPGLAEALVRLDSKRFDILLADLQGAGMDGLEVLKAAKKMDPNVSVILVAANGTIASVVNAIRAGGVDYLQKPIEPERLLSAIKRACEERLCTSESMRLPHELVNDFSFCGIIGKSPKMRQLSELIERLSHTDSTVFITGETGVGKELVARAIHSTSSRGEMPFVAINCGALTESLLESELFGHEKGAFTGAIKTKAGKFECAHRGTLFLDEIGDISSAMQVKLLRALQEKKVERVGGTLPIDVDVRVISATNQNIREKISRHEFRIDFFYRLNVIAMHVPPLRERAEDIPLLVQYIIDRLNKNLKRKIKGITPRAMKELLDYHWPGNVRELENVIERAYITCDAEIIDRFAFFQYGQGAPPPGSAERIDIDIPFDVARSVVITRFEKEYLTEALKRYRGNISETARRLGINPRTLWRKMKAYNLDRDSFKGSKEG